MPRNSKEAPSSLQLGHILYCKQTMFAQRIGNIPLRGGNILHDGPTQQRCERGECLCNVLSIILFFLDPVNNKTSILKNKKCKSCLLGACTNQLRTGKSIADYMVISLHLVVYVLNENFLFCSLSFTHRLLK